MLARALFRSRSYFIPNPSVASTSKPPSSPSNLRRFFNADSLVAHNPVVDLERSLDEERARDQLKPNDEGFIKSKIARGIFGYQTYVGGEDTFKHRTIKKFEDEEAVKKQCLSLIEMSPEFFMHPLTWKTGEEEYFLEFPFAVLSLKDFLEQLGQSESPPSTEAILKILASVRHCLNYLYQKAKIPSHGSLLEDGLVIRRDLKCFLAHLNTDSLSQPDRTTDLNDLQSLVTLMLSTIKPTDDDNSYKRLVMYEDFLKRRINDQGNSKLSPEDHMCFMVNHPASFSTEEKCRFMMNMYKLYNDETPDPANPGRTLGLKDNPVFTEHLDKLYPDWDQKLGDGELRKIYEAGKPKTRGADIVSFIGDCLERDPE